MTARAASTSVRASITVEVPIARAFSVFTEGIGTWWPDDHQMREGVVAMGFEPRVGGRVYDRVADGSESRWGRVLVYEPPSRVVFSWDLTSRWQIETDLDRTSEVEVTFTAEGPSRTHVVLEHSKLDRHGDGWEEYRDSVGSRDGWQGLMDAFARVAAA
ncbi:MAG: SRPBCC family protein [Candidatus Dormibacteria bacterium]|jgi:uncharacterized protein YndB with AHSA1/START domain